MSKEPWQESNEEDIYYEIYYELLSKGFSDEYSRQQALYYIEEKGSNINDGR